LPELPAAGPGYEPPIRAGLGWRIGARVCDVIILGWIITVVMVEIEGHLFRNDLRTFNLNGFLVIAIALSAALEVVPMAARGVTPGKAMLGLEVVSARDGGPVGVAPAILRWVVLYGPLLVPVGGWVILAVNAGLVVVHGRGLHDRAAGTTVVTSSGRGRS
jgi:uncharacterized RDD family membrane protein YckC